MRLPRRVPWQSISELEQLCSWIYTDEQDAESKRLALNRLSAWKATTSLPHALDATLGILSVIYQDNVTGVPQFGISLRQSYASAIVRLVNGLVDPLQIGVYARSIASIAAQLDLPPWLVELRHAATHEELPSLEILREAARQSMSWLLHNYFLPTINPSSAQSHAPQLSSPEPILKQYKNLMKSITRDASLAPSYKSSVTALLRDIERWLAEAKLVYGFSAALDWETSGNDLDDTPERFALEKLCDALLEKGGLVPLSKSKRSVSEESFFPAKSALELWTPLLTHVQQLHTDFSSILAQRIIAQLLTDQLSENDNRSDDTTYTQCIARWAFWAVHNVTDDTEADDIDSKREIAVALLTGLGPTKEPNTKGRKAAFTLLNELESSLPYLKSLSAILAPAAHQAPHEAWTSLNIEIMEKRLEALMASDSPLTEKALEPLALHSPSMSVVSHMPGWRLLDQPSGWKPCPIGVYIPPI